MSIGFDENFQHEKPFHVIRIIFPDVILGQKFVMIFRQTSYCSKTELPIKKVNNNTKILWYHPKIMSQNKVQDDMNEFEVNTK